MSLTTLSLQQLFKVDSCLLKLYKAFAELTLEQFVVGKVEKLEQLEVSDAAELASAPFSTFILFLSERRTTFPIEPYVWECFPSEIRLEVPPALG